MAEQQKIEKKNTYQMEIDLLGIKDDDKKANDPVELAYGPNELDSELNSVKEISVHDNQQQVLITDDIIVHQIGFKAEIQQNNLVQVDNNSTQKKVQVLIDESEVLADANNNKQEAEQIEKVITAFHENEKYETVTRPIGFNLPEINCEFYQQYDPTSSNKNNEIKNNVNASEKIQLNIDFKNVVPSAKKEENILNNDDNEKQEIITRSIGIDLAGVNCEFYQQYNPADIQQKSDIFVDNKNDDDNGLKIKQNHIVNTKIKENDKIKIITVQDEFHDKKNDDKKEKSPIEKSSKLNLPIKIKISHFQQSTSSDNKKDSDNRKSQANVLSLVEQFEGMGSLIKSKKIIK